MSSGLFLQYAIAALNICTNVGRVYKLFFSP